MGPPELVGPCHRWLFGNCRFAPDVRSNASSVKSDLAELVDLLCDVDDDSAMEMDAATTIESALSALKLSNDDNDVKFQRKRRCN